MVIPVREEKQYRACPTENCGLHVMFMRSGAPCPGCGQMVKPIYRPRSDVSFTIAQAEQRRAGQKVAQPQRQRGSSRRRTRRGWRKDGGRIRSAGRRSDAGDARPAELGPDEWNPLQ